MAESAATENRTGSGNIVHTRRTISKATCSIPISRFWSTTGRNGAGPARLIAPILDEIAGEYSGSLKVCKLDIDSNQATPAKYGIRGIPTLMLFKDGEIEATKVGALSKSQLAAFLR